MNNDERPRLPKRDLVLLNQLARDDMAQAIDDWLVKDSFVEQRGRTEHDRAWACFRQWIRGQRTASPGQYRALALAPELFRLVMRSRFPTNGSSDYYRVAVSPQFVEEKVKPSRRPTRRRSSPRPVQRPQASRKR